MKLPPKGSKGSSHVPSVPKEKATAAAKPRGILEKIKDQLNTAQQWAQQDESTVNEVRRTKDMESFNRDPSDFTKGGKSHESRPRPEVEKLPERFFVRNVDFNIPKVHTANPDLDDAFNQSQENIIRIVKDVHESLSEQISFTKTQIKVTDKNVQRLDKIIADLPDDDDWRFLEDRIKRLETRYRSNEVSHSGVPLVPIKEEGEGATTQNPNAFGLGVLGGIAGATALRVLMATTAAAFRFLIKAKGGVIPALGYLVYEVLKDPANRISDPNDPTGLNKRGQELKKQNEEAIEKQSNLHSEIEKKRQQARREPDPKKAEQLRKEADKLNEDYIWNQGPYIPSWNEMRERWGEAGGLNKRKDEVEIPIAPPPEKMKDQMKGAGIPLPSFPGMSWAYNTIMGDEEKAKNALLNEPNEIETSQSESLASIDIHKMDIKLNARENIILSAQKELVLKGRRIRLEAQEIIVDGKLVTPETASKYTDRLSRELAPGELPELDMSGQMTPEQFAQYQQQRLGRGGGGARYGTGNRRGSGPSQPQLSPERQAIYDDWIKNGTMSEEQAKTLGWVNDNGDWIGPAGMTKSIDPKTNAITYGADIPNLSDEQLDKRIRSREGDFSMMIGDKNVNITDKDIERLAKISALEARSLEGGSPGAMNAVVQTVLNRTASPDFDNDIQSVISANKQFSPVNPYGNIDLTPSPKNIEEHKARVREYLAGLSQGNEPEIPYSHTQFLNPSISGSHALGTWYQDMKKQGDIKQYGSGGLRHEHGSLPEISVPEYSIGANAPDMEITDEMRENERAAYQKQQRISQFPKSMFGRQNYSTVSKTGTEKFGVMRGNIEGVDQKLVNVVDAASRDLPPGWNVKMISGKDARSTGTKNHPTGLAMDVQIYDDKGNLIPHDRNSPGWKHYEKLYRSVNQRGKSMYPDEEFIWGGAWISSAAGRGDPMHFQLKDPNVRGSSQSSGRYTMEGGLAPGHPFIQEGGQLTADERAAWDEQVKQNIANEAQPIEANQPRLITPEQKQTQADVLGPLGVTGDSESRVLLDMNKEDEFELSPYSGKDLLNPEVDALQAKATAMHDEMAAGDPALLPPPPTDVPTGVSGTSTTSVQGLSEAETQAAVEPGTNQPREELSLSESAEVGYDPPTKYDADASDLDDTPGTKPETKSHDPDPNKGTDSDKNKPTKNMGPSRPPSPKDDGAGDKRSHSADLVSICSV